MIPSIMKGRYLMRKSMVLLLTLLLLLSACANASPSGMSGAASEENSAVSETASASNHEIPLLTPLRPDQKTEILACFNEVDLIPLRSDWKTPWKKPSSFTAPAL